MENAFCVVKFTRFSDRTEPKLLHICTYYYLLHTTIAFRYLYIFDCDQSTTSLYRLTNEDSYRLNETFCASKHEAKNGKILGV